MTRASRVVDGAERGHRARLDPPHLAQQVGGAERKAPAGAELPVQALEVDIGVFQRHHQVKLVFLVAQEQVLGMAARNLPAQSARLLDREQRRMLHRRMRDAEAVEIGKELVGRLRHGANNRGSGKVAKGWRYWL